MKLKTMLLFLGGFLALLFIVFLYMQQAKFGKAPSGERLEKMKLSPRFKDGKFENTTFTPTLTKGYSMLGLLYDQLFKKHPNLRPKKPIPSTKIDLKSLSIDENVLVWFGHSSYFLQLDGKKILVDPVFSGNASPIPGSVKAFDGTDQYTVDDLPSIDFLLISHDHYDHLDYETIKLLKDKIGLVVCALGVGSHLEYWGYPLNKIIEKDWNETIELGDNITINTTEARHFSGRGFNRNNTLWTSFVLKTPSKNIFIGGDSGYDKHFKEIGEKYGPFDLAILEDGQYNLAWEAIHMLPEQVLMATIDLKAKHLFPVHNSKFALAWHPWYEPLKEISTLNKEKYNLSLVTPIIGQKVDLNLEANTFKEWWLE